MSNDYFLQKCQEIDRNSLMNIIKNIDEKGDNSSEHNSSKRNISSKHFYLNKATKLDSPDKLSPTNKLGTKNEARRNTFEFHQKIVEPIKNKVLGNIYNNFRYFKLYVT